VTEKINSTYLHLYSTATEQSYRLRGKIIGAKCRGSKKTGLHALVEFSFCIPDMGFNAIRVECIAEVVEDDKVRAEVYNSPEHALIRLTPTKFTVLMPPAFENVTISPT
jgi:hypothetical protein